LKDQVNEIKDNRYLQQEKELSLKMISSNSENKQKLGISQITTLHGENSPNHWL
jgi:hypothetical protein